MINRILRYFHSPRSITIIDRTICSRVDRHLRVSCAFADVHARNTQERNEIRNELAHAAKGKEREREREEPEGCRSQNQIYCILFPRRCHVCFMLEKLFESFTNNNVFRSMRYCYFINRGEQ